METKEYIVAQTGWLDGCYRIAGDKILLTSAAAQHLLAGGLIAIAPDNAKPKKTAAGEV